MSLPRFVGAIAVLVLISGTSTAQDTSRCFGTTSNGSLENGWKLPDSGPNFSAYSTIGRMLGRTYVHSVVYEIVIDSYEALAEFAPGTVFVYGETGKRGGGEFKPHKTHQNGLSVDFMVPVINASGESVPLPTSVLNKWGYGLEFDGDGRLDELQIDADTMAEHIYQLHRAASNNGVDIWRVIFDPELQPLLHDTDRWEYLRDNIEFSSSPSWVRHDEHYHVDFEVPCGILF